MKPLAVCVVVGLAVGSLAAQEVGRISITDAPPGTPSLGAGLRLGSGPYKNADPQLDLVPLYLYEGKWLYAHGTTAGVHAYRNKFFSFDGFVRYRFLTLDPDDDEFLEGLTKREQTIDGGLSVSFRGKWGSVHAAWMTDLLGEHEGNQYELAYRRRFDRGRWVFSPWITLEWWDQDLANYYFGVTPKEARTGRPAYLPGNSFNLSYGLNALFKSTDSIELFANIGFREWDRDITESPIVDDRISTALYVGATYTFGNVYGPAKGAPTERAGEWAWRINYGYQAEGNIVGTIDQGDFSKSTEVSTNIGGLTYSHLLNAGPRVDFLGRVGLYRHFEEPFQENFNSYAAWIMAMGKGFSRWTERPFFRWGFGFGFNYAMSVPAAEQISAEEKNRKTNNLLNYLEMQLDFSISAMTGGRGGVFKNCYIGTTIVHRSGIFSLSDLLGNVFGGSDWVTAHLECVR